VVDDRVIGPYFFEGAVTGASYTRFLLEELPVLLEDLPLELRHNMWFQQDGAPPHFALQAQNSAVELFHDRTIGRGRLLTRPWPPRCPDLTVMDFSFWGIVKDDVYATACDDCEEMKDRIRASFRRLDGSQAMRNATASAKTRMEMCFQEGGIRAIIR